MKFLSKNIIIIVVLALASSILHAQKPMRVGYVDMDYILDNLDEYKIANEQFALKVKEWEQEITEKQNEIERRKKELEAEKPLLTPELIKDKEEEIAILEHQLIAYQQKRFGAEDGDYMKQRITLVRPIQDQVFNIVQEIGKSKNYDYIAEKSDVSLLYVNDRHDLSNMILRVLNKQTNAEDRKKNIGELLQENYNFEMADERRQKETERNNQRKDIILTKQAEREARRQKILEERRARLEQKEKAKQEAIRKREEARKKKEEERKNNNKD